MYKSTDTHSVLRESLTHLQLDDATTEAIIANYSYRLSNAKLDAIDSPEKAAAQFDNIRDKKQEHFAMITLDGARNVIKKHTVTIGTLMSSLVHPREVFSRAIKDNAASIIIAHNHPSGNLNISECDREVTRRIKQAGEIMGIHLDDHIIVNKAGAFVSAM